MITGSLLVLVVGIIAIIGSVIGIAAAIPGALRGLVHPLRCLWWGLRPVRRH